MALAGSTLDATIARNVIINAQQILLDESATIFLGYPATIFLGYPKINMKNLYF